MGAMPRVCYVIAVCLGALKTCLLVLLQSGAKHVYGIECSAIADQAKRIVADNGFSDRVTIIKGKVSMLAPLSVNYYHLNMKLPRFGASLADRLTYHL